MPQLRIIRLNTAASGGKTSLSMGRLLAAVCLLTTMATVWVLAEWSPASYVQVPAGLEYDGRALDWLAELVGRQTTAASPQEVSDYLADMMDAIQVGRALPIPYGDVDPGAVKRELRHLLRLAKTSLSSCQHDEVDQFIVAVRHLFGRLEVLAANRQVAGPAEPAPNPLLGYLRHFARAKFSTCSQRYYEYQLHSGFGMAHELDHLIGSQDAHEGHIGEEHLLELARMTDLAAGHFDAAKMKGAQRRLSGGKSPMLDWRAAHKLIGFVSKRCASFLAAFRHPLNMVNINRLVNPDEAVPNRMLTLNEFARLCHQIGDPDTSKKVRANFRHQLQATKIRL